MPEKSVGSWRMPPERLKEELRTLLIVTFGSALYCVGTVFFIKPAMLPNAGLMGVCLFLNYVFGIPLGVSNSVLNLALFIFAYKFLPKRFFWWTLYSVVLVSFFMEFFETLPKPAFQDKMLLVIVSAILQGVALGTVFATGGSTGGTDIISVACRRKFGIELGNTTMYMNFAVILLFLRVVPLENLVFGFLQSYLTSLVLNGGLRASAQRREALIITGKPELVRNYIVYTLHRGVTIFDAHGGWDNQHRCVIVSLLAPRQENQLKRFMQANDPTAFMRLSIASEVHGQGFQNWED
ncbi:MAG: YitT family protein [Pyramidobacter sp.]|jgi:uncharacterized membrane-anchored protein YitT (DUF2179 family)